MFQMKVSLEKLSSLDDVDQCTAYYNYAVILYRLQQYTQAVAILDRVFQFIEPMGESVLGMGQDHFFHPDIMSRNRDYCRM